MHTPRILLLPQLNHQISEILTLLSIEKTCLVQGLYNARDKLNRIFTFKSGCQVKYTDQIKYV